MKNMPLALIYIARAALLSIAFWTTGCASVRLIDTQVNSFVPQQVAAGASYQFDRLPSQQADTVAQTRLEQLAGQALAKAGLRQAQPADLRVQVSAVQRQDSTAGSNGMNIGLQLGWVLGNGSVMLGNRGMLIPGLDAQPNYWRQVSLVMRDTAGAVVFESHASHEGIWADSDPVLAAMLDAALQGFPAPPTGSRRVNIEIPR